MPVAATAGGRRGGVTPPRGPLKFIRVTALFRISQPGEIPAGSGQTQPVGRQVLPGEVVPEYAITIPFHQPVTEALVAGPGKPFGKVPDERSGTLSVGSEFDDDRYPPQSLLYYSIVDDREGGGEHPARVRV